MSDAPARSALGWRPLGTHQQPPQVVALVGRGSRLEPALTRLAQRWSVALLEPPRRADPRRFGLPSSSGDWYLGDDTRPDPASFGLCLAQLEAFVLEHGRTGPLLLVGAGQGTALVLALASCWPERLIGVVALGGALPDLPEDALARPSLARLRVALRDVGGDADSLARRGAALQQLRPREDWHAIASGWLGASQAGGGSRAC